MAHFPIWRQIRRGLAIAGVTLLAGCTVVTNPMDRYLGTNVLEGFQWLAALSVVSIINTDKTLTDHVVSAISGEDCSTVRYLSGDYYCDRPEPPQPPLYCYRSLGEITCFERSDPYGIAAKPVDWPPTRSRSM